MATRGVSTLWFSLSLLFLAILLAPANAQGAVAGVDLGSHFFKSALVQPGRPFQIVIDSNSKRKTPSLVAFDDNSERIFGSDAGNIFSRRPHLAIVDAIPLLGRTCNESDPIVKLVKSQNPGAQFCEGGSPSTKAFFTIPLRLLEDSPDSIDFTVEEAVAMIFSHAMDQIEKDAERPVPNLVLTVPEHYGVNSREALMDAAELIGANVMALINENSAAALHFAIDRTFDSETNVK